MSKIQQLSRNLSWWGQLGTLTSHKKANKSGCSSYAPTIKSWTCPCCQSSKEPAELEEAAIRARIPQEMLETILELRATTQLMMVEGTRKCRRFADTTQSCKFGRSAELTTCLGDVEHMRPSLQRTRHANPSCAGLRSLHHVAEPRPPIRGKFGTHANERGSFLGMAWFFSKWEVNCSPNKNRIPE